LIAGPEATRSRDGCRGVPLVESDGLVALQ